MAINITPANLSSLQKSIQQTNSRLGESLQKLSSGKRINRASDDAAGLAISEKLNAQLSSLSQATKNVSAGSALLRTAEGGLNQIGDLLARGRELAIQASTGTLSGAQRQTLNREFSAVKKEIDRISATTEFNGQKLLTGELGPNAANPPSVQVGTGAGQADRIAIDAIASTTIQQLDVGNASIDTVENARAALSSIDNAIAQVTDSRATVGALENRFQSTANNLSVTIENLTAAESSIRDTDYAKETSRQKVNEILQQAGISALKSGLSQAKSLIGSLLNIKG